MPDNAYRPLSDAQARAALSYAMYAQRHLRLELSWEGDQMQLRLVNNEEKRRI